MYGRLALGSAKIGGAVSRAVSSGKESNCSSVGWWRSLAAFFRNMSERGNAILEYSFTKRRYTLHAPKKLRNCVIDSGNLASRTAQVALASFETNKRLGVITWPRYSTLSWKKKHFFSFNFTPLRTS